MSEQRHNPSPKDVADPQQRRAPLTTVLILVAVATTLSGRPVVLNGGHDAAPRLERRHLVQLLAEDFEQETEPQEKQTVHGPAALPARWAVAVPPRLPFARPLDREADQSGALAANADWRRRLVNLPPPVCA
jgi:hypothetical protein